MDTHESERSEGSEARSSGSASSREAWREVGDRFAALSDSIVNAVRTAWKDEESQKAVNEIEAGLRSAARSVADSVDEAAASPEGRRIREEAEEAARSVREAGEQAAREARPHVAKALWSLSEGLRSVADELSRHSVLSKSEESDMSE